MKSSKLALTLLAVAIGLIGCGKEEPKKPPVAVTPPAPPSP